MPDDPTPQELSDRGYDESFRGDALNQILGAFHGGAPEMGASHSNLDTTPHLDTFTTTVDDGDAVPVVGDLGGPVDDGDLGPAPDTPTSGSQVPAGPPATDGSGSSASGMTPSPAVFDPAAPQAIENLMTKTLGSDGGDPAGYYNDFFDDIEDAILYDDPLDVPEMLAIATVLDAASGAPEAAGCRNRVIVLVGILVAIAAGGVALALALSSGGPGTSSTTSATATSTPSSSVPPATTPPPNAQPASLTIGGEHITSSHSGAFPCTPGNPAYYYTDYEFIFRGAGWQIAATSTPTKTVTTEPAGKGAGKIQVALYDNATKATYDGSGGEVTLTPDGMVTFNSVTVDIGSSPTEISGTLRCH